MNDLCQAQPPPRQKTLLDLRALEMNDDAAVVLVDIQRYLMGLGLSIKMDELKDGHFQFEVEGDIESQKDIILDVIKFYAHGHWEVTERGGTPCQEQP